MVLHRDTTAVVTVEGTVVVAVVVVAVAAAAAVAVVVAIEMIAKEGE